MMHVFMFIGAVCGVAALAIATTVLWMLLSLDDEPARPN